MADVALVGATSVGREALRPFVRLGVAAALPFVVPAVVVAMLWALPADPAEILCPPEICTGGDALAAEWRLDEGPAAFFGHWLAEATQGEFGPSWRVQPGVQVASMLLPSVGTTLGLALLALLPLLAAATLAVAGRISPRLDPLWHAVGLMPAVIVALLAAAWVQLTYGAASHDGWPGWLRLGLGAISLALADGAMAAAVVGSRETVGAELRRRYVRMAILRGESVGANVLPNVLPSLGRQLRARALAILSGTVVVEVVLGLPGLGDLLFLGTLLQDFAVVLAAAWAFALISSALLAVHAAADLALAWWMRQSSVRA